MKKASLVLLIVLVAGLTAGSGASAQGEELTLRLSRDWGYGGLNGDIQGRFSMKVNGPTGLARVEFYIDDTKIGEATSAPFSLQFVTDDYPLGTHFLRAVGYTGDGRELRSQAIGANFVPESAGSTMILRIVVPLVAVIFGAMLLTFVLSMVTGRKAKSLPPGTPRQYPLGGGICPKCGRPLAYHLFGLNMVVGKLDRCPYCGRWSVVKRASIEQLRSAEQAELETAKEQIPTPSEEERLRKELDDSKYVGG
jgi:hypothetical protein